MGKFDGREIEVKINQKRTGDRKTKITTKIFEEMCVCVCVCELCGNIKVLQIIFITCNAVKTSS